MRHVDLSWPDLVSAEMTPAEVRAPVAAGSAAAFSQAFGREGASHEYCCLVRACRNEIACERVLVPTLPVVQEISS